METKTCSKCGVTKNIEEFSKHKYTPSGYQSQCKQCATEYITNWRRDNAEKQKVYKKMYREEHKEYFIEKHKEWKKNHKETTRENAWKSRSIIFTCEEYELLFVKQNGVCAICGLPETSYDRKIGVIRRLAVDHDHKTGNIRGLLCHNCNVGIGHMNDNIELLKSAISYLQKYQ